MISHLPDTFSQLAAIFLSIIIEALPFVLFGCLISGIIETYLSPDIVNRYLPKNRFGVSSWALWLVSFSLLRVWHRTNRQPFPEKESPNLYRHSFSYRSTDD
jgi:hypothetical protein